MEGFPKDIQNLILRQLCLDTGGSTFALLPLLKTNRTFHAWTVRYVIEQFDEKHLTYYVSRMLPNLSGSEIKEWNLRNALTEQWESQPSMLASFFIFLHVEYTQTTHRCVFGGVRILYNMVTRIFWSNNTIFRALMEKNVIVRSLRENKERLYDKNNKVRQRQHELDDIVLERNQLESETSLLEEKLDELDSKMKKRKI
jgi:hypothetical protein